MKRFILISIILPEKNRKCERGKEKEEEERERDGERKRL